MTDERSDNRDSPPKGKRAGPPAPDERDATIERLERTLVEERQNSATLRETVDGLHFKVEVLEKGYSKQLADARSRSEKAEKELATLKAEVAALGTGGEETLRLLTETRAELERITAERDRLHKQLGLSHRPQTKTLAKASAQTQSEDGGTINALMANSNWVRERQAAGDDHLHAQVRADPEPPPTDMLAPELVFTKDSDDEDDDEEDRPKRVRG